MYNIMKEDFGLNKNRKITINHKDSKLVNIHKIVRYLKKNSQFNYNITDTIKYLKEIVIGNLSKVEDLKSDEFKIIDILNLDREGVDVYKIEGSKLNCQYVLVDYDNGIGAKHDGNIITAVGNRIGFYTFNAQSLYTIGKIREGVEIKYKDKNKMYGNLNKELEELGVPPYKVIDEIYSNLFTNISYKKLNNAYKHKVYQEVITEIYNYLMFAYNLDINYKRMDYYIKENKTDYAKVFKTKKNISNKVKSEMESSPFLKYFTYVELDNDTDLVKYYKVYEEWEKVRKILPNITGLELRFRKLGQLRASGVYFPLFKCISLDIRDVSSFVHEYAHAIDFSRQGVLSLDKEFSSIVSGYSLKYDTILARGVEDVDYYKRKSDYFKSTTEVFARGLEYYLILKGYNTPLSASLEDMNKIQYRSFKGLEEDLIKYFSKIVKIK